RSSDATTSPRHPVPPRGIAISPRDLTPQMPPVVSVSTDVHVRGGGGWWLLRGSSLRWRLHRRIARHVAWIGCGGFAASWRGISIASTLWPGTCLLSLVTRE